MADYDITVTVPNQGPPGPQGPPGITDASLLDSGTLADARLSSNVPLKDAANTYSANQTLDGTNNVAPNQTAASGSSIMTRALGDARFVRSTIYSNASTITLADSTTLADLSGFAVTIESGARYFLEASIQANSDDNTAGLKLAWAFTGTAPTVRSYRSVLYPGAGGNVTSSASYFALTNAQQDTHSQALLYLMARFVAPSAGTWTLQAAKINTGATVRIITGSFLKATRID
jgi:hypothetical protein